MQEKLTLKIAADKLLAGTATGIIIGLIPNAVLSAILKLFGTNPLAMAVAHIALIFQMGTPLLIGTLIALQFGFSHLQVLSIGGAAFAGSGVIKFTPATTLTGTPLYVGSGTGDIINTMLTATLAVGLTLLIAGRFGSVAIILTPIVVGVGVGTVGFYLYPYVSMITTAIGKGINGFTTMQPLVMSLLIGCSFALLIISPISTVAIGLAIQLSGISAGAAAMGVAATTFVLVVNSWRVNKAGVTLATALGAMKMFMPNLFRRPIILVPCFFTAILSALTVAAFGIKGLPTSAGFGLVGLVGPITSVEQGLNLGLAVVAWFVVPLAASLLSLLLFEKMLKLYDRKEVFEFLGDK